MFICHDCSMDMFLVHSQTLKTVMKEIVADSMRCAGLSKLKGLRLDPVESNIVIFRLSEGHPPIAVVLDRLKQAGVLMGCMRGGIRAVTHSQVSVEDCRQALAAVEEALSTEA